MDSFRYRHTTTPLPSRLNREIHLNDARYNLPRDPVDRLNPRPLTWDPTLALRPFNTWSLVRQVRTKRIATLLVVILQHLVMDRKITQARELMLLLSLIKRRTTRNTHPLLNRRMLYKDRTLVVCLVAYCPPKSPLLFIVMRHSPQKKTPRRTRKHTK